MIFLLIITNKCGTMSYIKIIINQEGILMAKSYTEMGTRSLNSLLTEESFIIPTYQRPYI